MPPLSPWLQALALPVAADPVLAGRLLSVLFAFFLVPALYVFVRELWRTLEPRGAESSGAPALLTALLAVFCPYLALHQRLALVESLFVLESVAVASVSLGLSRAGPHGRKWGALLAVALGAAFLTRQNFSYLLVPLPVAAYLLCPRSGRRPAREFFLALLCAVLVASALLLPVLMAAGEFDLTTHLFHSRLLLEPMGLGGRLDMARENSIEIGRWIWTYMTPPVALLAAVSLAALFAKRVWRIATFLSIWFLLIVAPLVVFGRFIFSRYGVLMAVPMLVLAAGFLARLGRRRPVAAAAASAFLLLWSGREVLLQIRDWREPRLVSSDRFQLVSGWPAGAATEQSIVFIERLVKTSPVLLLAPRNEGNPMDSLWVAFWDSNRVRTYSAGDVLSEPILRPVPGSPNGILADRNPRRGLPAEVVARKPGEVVVHVSPEPVRTAEGLVPSALVLGPRNPRLERLATFWNPPAVAGQVPSEGVAVYRLD